MSEQTTNPENGTDYTQSDNGKINNVVALTQLVGTIVDYYSFKSKLMEDDDEPGKWNKESSEENMVVPSKLDTIIEKAFTAQLNKFTE